MNLKSCLLSALAFGGLTVGVASAQTTHTVDLLAISFDPANIDIDVGDTIDFVWVDGFHNVVSGAGGIPDGAFDSGSPVGAVGNVFSVTFDAAFLAANPMPNNDYPYYCIVHLGFGMVGNVHVKTPGSATPYGCTNPAGSLTAGGPAPQIGSNYFLRVDNPTGNHPAGSLAFIFLSLGPLDLGGGCGLPLSGFDMASAFGTGELLLDVTPGLFILPPLGPQVYPGPGTPSQFAIPLPPNPSLVGVHLYHQGLLANAAAVPPAPVLGLTNGMDVLIGG